LRWIEVLPVNGIPEVSRGTDLAKAIVDSLRRSRLTLRDGDIVVIKQKVVS
jgi:coenzyme F420-0:L-glutamate ligase/coenzyme F420-1:gamma-L-glutamate ligase